MKFQRILVVLILANFAFANAQTTLSIFSPGIKLGYTFGDPGGFTYGVELSYVEMVNHQPYHGLPYGFSYGPVFNLDRFDGVTRLHLGFETVLGVGLCIGPTLVIQDGRQHWGYSVIPFIGLIVYPYYNFTSAGDFRFNEVGSYLKFPILPRGYFNF